MITPEEYNNMLTVNRGPTKEKIEDILSNMLESEAERLTGTPIILNLMTERETTQQERDDWNEDVAGRSAPRFTVDWRASEVEAGIAVEILQEAGWYVKDDEPKSKGYSPGWRVIINDVPFDEDEEDIPQENLRYEEIKAYQAVTRFNNKNWFKRLFTTRIK